MGIGFASTTVFKRQNLFVLHVPDITHVGNSASRIFNRVVIEEKAARPKLTYAEIEVNHVIEKIRFAGRPDWEPLRITLYDVAQTNPVWNWITSNYYVRSNQNQVAVGYKGGGSTGYKRNVQIFMLDGCGNALEAWNYMNAYPVDADWGQVDMSRTDVLRVEMTLRYDRAYWQPCSPSVISAASAYMFR